MIGLSYGNFASSGSGRGSGFDPAALAIIAQMTTNGSTPTAERQLLINQISNYKSVIK